eukprot:IDg5224t1
MSGHPRPRMQDVGAFVPFETYNGPCAAAVTGSCNANRVIHGGSHHCTFCKKYMHAICGKPSDEEELRVCPICSGKEAEALARRTAITSKHANASCLGRAQEEGSPGENGIFASASTYVNVRRLNGVNPRNDPWGKGYLCDNYSQTFCSPSPRDCAYSFLRGQTVRNLRAIARSVQSSQAQTTKNGQICLLMLKAHDTIAASPNGTKTWSTDFWRSTERVSHRSEKSMVARNFNDPHVKVAVDFRGLVDPDPGSPPINPNATPVERRGGAVLKGK